MLVTGPGIPEEQRRKVFAIFQRLHSEPPNLIFLDINMPLMNGWDFLEAYGDLPDHKKAGKVVVMLTSSFNEEERERAEAYDPVAGFLTKPRSGSNCSRS